MTSTAMGEGERREAACRRRAMRVNLISVGIAAALIALAWFGKREGGGTDPVWAGAAALLYLGAMLWSLRLGIRNADEFEGRATLRALATGMIVFALVFPVWMFLGDAGLVPEPDAQRLFTISVVSAMLSHFWSRFR